MAVPCTHVIFSDALGDALDLYPITPSRLIDMGAGSGCEATKPAHLSHLDRCLH